MRGRRMSIKVMTQVWEHSVHKGGPLLLLLAIADHAHDDGDGAYPSIQTLAHKTRLSERHTTRLLQELAGSGELVIREKEGPRGVNVYRVTFSQSGAVLSGDILSGDNGGGGVVTPMAGVVTPMAGGGDIAMSPKPSLEPSLEPPVPPNGGTTPPQNVDRALFFEEHGEPMPDWYATLQSIPKFATPFPAAAAWLKAKGITEDYAETTAYALKGRWDGKKYRDPWATFQNWAKRPALAGRENGKFEAGTGKVAPSALGKY